MSRCGIVILAAGASSRMGTAKQSLLFEGSTLLRRAVKTASLSRCRPVVVVLGAGGDALSHQLSDLSASIVQNPQWAAGMGTSIRAGVSTMASAKPEAVMIFLCDQPLVSSQMLDRMVDAHFASGRPMTAAYYADTLGTPVVFSSELIPELLKLEDTQGGKTLLQRYPDRVNVFPLAEGAIDVDTPEDYRKLSASPGGDESTPV